MSSFRIHAKPVKPDESVQAHELFGPFYLPLDIYRTTELGDGQFGRFRTEASPASAYVRIREHAKQLHTVQRLCRLVAKRYPRAIRRVLLWVVPREDCADASEILDAFQRDPEVVDYTRVWGFKIAVEVDETEFPKRVIGEGQQDHGAATDQHASPAEVWQWAVWRMICENRRACGLDGDGAQEEQEEQAADPSENPRPAKRQRAQRPRSAPPPDAMLREVHRANDEVYDYDDKNMMFRLGAGTADWSGTFLSADGLRFMLCVIADDVTDFYKTHNAYAHRDGFNAGAAWSFGNPRWNEANPDVEPRKHAFRGAHVQHLYPQAFSPSVTDPADADALPGTHIRPAADGRLAYSIPADHFMSREIFATKRFPKFWPTHAGIHEHIEGCRAMSYMDAARGASATATPASVWEVLRRAIETEKERHPAPGAWAARALMLREAGAWRGAAGVTGLEEDAPRRAWRGAIDGAPFAVHTVSHPAFDDPNGARAVLEMECARHGQRPVRYRLVADGDERRLETGAEWRERSLKRWFSYFDECWEPGPMMGNSLSSVIKHFAALESETGESLHWPRGPNGAGWALPHVNINPQLNVFTIVLDIMEKMGCTVNHHNAARAFFAFKGACKRPLESFKKPPHMLWVGPRSAGKSWMAELVASMLPPNIFEVCSHVSDQAYYGQAPCADTFTQGKVFFFDEGDINKLGGRASKTMETAANSVDKRSTEYKEKLTRKSSVSTVLGYDEEKQRKVLQFETSNENVQARNGAR